MMRLVLLAEAELIRLIDEWLERARSFVQTEVPLKEYLSNAEALECLGISRATLQRWRNSGGLPYSKIGSRIYYRRENITAFLDGHRKR